MALGINSYNDVFRNFAEFAQKSLEAGDEKAIAAVDEQMSEDGKTATITQTISADLAAPQSSQDAPVLFGSASFTQRLVIDLTQDIPTVVDYKLSQAIA
ncbi:MAG: hypothetical protein IKF72_05485 [Kiritimatiellae bacterium]|nr:hypothetical protein [Kiritimatiellia bacterium]